MTRPSDQTIQDVALIARNGIDRAIELERERDALTDILRRHGFVPCDIAACNCGSWHHRYGLRQRMDEVKEALADAGHPLCNENGHLVSKALAALIEERDALRAALLSVAAAADTNPHCPVGHVVEHWPGVRDAVNAARAAQEKPDA